MASAGMARKFPLELALCLPITVVALVAVK
mgnify:CR=1 FL=1